MHIRMEAEFSDADEFLHQVGIWGWEGRVSQIGPGDFKVSLQMLGDHRSRVMRTQHSVANLRETHTPSGARTFGLVIPQASTNAWCGKGFDRAMLQMMPRSDYVASNSGGHLGYQLVFPDEIIEETLASLERPALLDHSARRIELDMERALRIGSRIDHDWLRKDSDPARNAADDVLVMLLEAFAAAPTRGRIRPDSRRRAVARAREFMEANLAEELTLADVCRVVGVSRRTLMDGFREQVGLSPMRYLKLIRLNRVHEALRRGGAVTTKIVDVANAVGFWHMGQLARDYRKLFGELPRETLARR